MKTKTFTSYATFLLSLMAFTWVLTACSDDNDEVKANPGLSTRTYKLDWKITNEDRQRVVMEDIQGGKFKSDFADYGDHNKYGGVMFAIQTLMQLETYDNQEDSEEVVELFQTLADLVLNDPDLQSMFNK